jgi:hypothetical protein
MTSIETFFVTCLTGIHTEDTTLGQPMLHAPIIINHKFMTVETKSTLNSEKLVQAYAKKRCKPFDLPTVKL